MGLRCWRPTSIPPPGPHGRRQHAARGQPDARSAGAVHHLRDRRDARRLHPVHRRPAAARRRCQRHLHLDRRVRPRPAGGLARLLRRADLRHRQARAGRRGHARTSCTSSRARSSPARCSPRRRPAAATRPHSPGRSTSCPPRTASRRTATSTRTRSRTPSTCGRSPTPRRCGPRIPTSGSSTAPSRARSTASPFPSARSPGPHPLGESHNEPVPPVEANDARMNQVVFAAGRLWGGVNTIANPGRATASPGSR